MMPMTIGTLEAVTCYDCAHRAVCKHKEDYHNQLTAASEAIKKVAVDMDLINLLRIRCSKFASHAMIHR